MANTVFIEYTMFCTSLSAYNAAKATLGGISTFLAPVTAAALLGSGNAAYTGTTPPANSIIYGLSPGNGLLATKLQPGTDITQAANHIELNPTPGSYDDGKYSYTPFHILPCGLQQITVQLVDPVWGPQSPITFAWSGTLINGGAGAPSGPAKRFLGARRWVDGFELPAMGGAGPSGERDTSFHANSRDASRTIDGFGLAIRNQTSNGVLAQQLPNPSGNFLTYPSTSWERFYFRPRKFPTTGADEFWAAHGIFEGAGDACLMTIDSGGVIHVFNCGNLAFPGLLIGTGPALALNTWYRFDIRIHFRTPTEDGTFRLYINGSRVLNIDILPGSSGTGLDLNGNLHTASLLGVSTLAASPHASAYDFDDWISADEVVNPPGFPGTTAPGMDLSSGSHVVAIHATGFGPGHSGAWTGDWRCLNQRPPTSLDATTAVVTAAVPSAQIDVTTDYASQGDGCAAFIVAGGANTIPAGTGQIGWILNGLQTLFPYASAVGFNQSFPIRTVPSGTLANALPVIGSLNLEFQAPAAAGTTNMQALMAAAEMIGVFSAQDNDPTQPPVTAPPFSGIHNNPYPTQSSPGALLSAPAIVPVGAVTVSAGVYSGNNIGQDVFEQIAAHWWWCRSLTAAVGGTCWWSSMMAPDERTGTDIASSRITRAHLLNGVPSMEVAGSTPEANATGATYQWIAIADPAMRYLLNAACAQSTSDVTTEAHPLVNSSFTPIAAMFALEKYSGGGAAGPYYKGPGSTGANASPLTGAQVANILTMAAGTFSTMTATNWNAPQLAAAFFRLDDGTGNHWYDITSYVGNGAGGTRDIPVNLNGRFPLFALVVPANNNSFFRDPSHTGLNSTNVNNNSLSTTAIVGGAANIVTVGTQLNTNGVVYDVFVLPVAGAPFTNIVDIFGNPSAFTPVPIAPGPQGPFNPPPTPPLPPGADCISYAQAIVELQTRLGDLLSVHWTVAEIQEYLKEALRVYNALTMAYKGRASFLAQVGVPFYELPVQIPTLRGYTVLDQDEIRLLQYHLLEPPTPTAWSGTPQFSLADLTLTLQRRLDLYKFATGQVIDEAIVTVTPDAVGRVTLPLNVTDLRRVAWNNKQTPPTITPVLRAAEWDMNAYARQWPTPVGATPTRPLGYSVSETPPLVLQLAPAPTAIGDLDTLAVVRAPDLSPAVGVLLGIPDDFCWVPKWGALMDMLATSGPAGDPTRMAIAQILWDQGIAAARRSAVVLDARIGNGLTTSIVPVNAISEADYYLRSWQTTTGAPRRVLLAGNNLVALTPVPDNLAVYTVTLNVIRNIPIPVQLSDCFYEGGAAVTAALLDYAEFLANFKEGPAQAQAAFPLLQRFFTVCGIAVDLQSALMPQRGSMLQQTAQDERSPATFTEAAEPTDH
jgi:hypothetical protein